MMRLAITVGFVALLTACSGPTFTGDARAVHETCIANGGVASYCDCTTKELQAKLTPEVFTQVAKGVAGADPSATLEAMAAADKACAKK